MKNIKNIFIVGLIISGLGISTVALGATYGKQFPRATIAGVIEESTAVYKLVDGTTTCYITGKGFAISCVK